MRDMITSRDTLERARIEDINGRCWICLRANLKSQASAMCGPYTRNEIVHLLMTGGLTSSDYVWREGFTNWKMLSSIDMFQLPVPSFPRRLISWNSGSLDWNGPATVPIQARPIVTAPAPSTLADRAVDGALALIFVALGWIIWQMSAHYHRGVTVQSQAARTQAVARPAKPAAPKVIYPQHRPQSQYKAAPKHAR